MNVDLAVGHHQSFHHPTRRGTDQARIQVVRCRHQRRAPLESGRVYIGVGGRREVSVERGLGQPDIGTCTARDTIAAVF